MLDFLYLILPNRATERDDPVAEVSTDKSLDDTLHQSGSSLNTSATAPTCLLPSSQNGSSQKMRRSESICLSQRIYLKHPGGDRHPNPDHRSKAKTHVEIMQDISYGLEIFEHETRRQRRSSYTRWGFDFDYDFRDHPSSHTSSISDLSSLDERYILNQTKKVSTLICITNIQLS